MKRLSQPSHGLTRRLVQSLALTAMAVTFFIGASSFVFYTLMWRFLPEEISTAETWWPAPAEWAWLAVLLLVCPAAAALIAARLARGILAPVHHLAECLRRLAGGDLGTRATLADDASGEIGELLSDFNGMAARLQKSVDERNTWHAAIAHELRTPVTVLRGRLQGVADGVFTLSPSLTRGLLQQTESLSRLIEDLRVLSLAEGGRLLLQPSAVDLVQELTPLTRLVEPDLTAAGMQLSTDIAPATVWCDRARLGQMVLALLQNVRDHAAPGPVRLVAQVEAEELHLRVEDAGPGLDPALLPQVFDAFSRGEDARRRRVCGTGLGLAVVKAIAELHGGRVDCRPSVLGGSAFRVVLPVRADRQE